MAAVQICTALTPTIIYSTALRHPMIPLTAQISICLTPILISATALSPKGLMISSEIPSKYVFPFIHSDKIFP